LIHLSILLKDINRDFVSSGERKRIKLLLALIGKKVKTQLKKLLK